MQMKAECLTGGREKWTVCWCTAERPTQQPSVLSCFSSVARVAVGLMLYNITSDTKRRSRDGFDLFIGQMKNRESIWLPTFLGWVGGGVNKNRHQGEHPQSLLFVGSLTSSKLHFANYLRLMSVCWRLLPTFFFKSQRARTNHCL